MLKPLRSLSVGTAFTINPFTNRTGLITNAQKYLPGSDPLTADYAVEVMLTLPNDRTRNETRLLHPDVRVRV